MKWPWETTEKRDSNYTDVLIRTIVNRAGGTVANPSATGALEMASGTIARAFMAAEVEAEPMIPALSPSCLGFIGRELIRRGEAIFLIEVMGGMIKLLPSSVTTLTGSSDPATWLYQVNLAGPSGMATRTVRAEQVVHIRYSFDPERPWRGIGPLQAAALAGRLSAETLEALGDEASGPRGSFLPVPSTDGADDTLTGLRGDVANARGSQLFVESMSEGWESGSPRTPADWSPRRFGFMPPPGVAEISKMVTEEILGACGVSPILFNPRSSAAAREAWRVLLHGTIDPLGKLVSEELSRKLDTEVTLSFNDLHASDVQGRARAYKSLVDGGMSAENAARVVAFGNEG